MRAAQGASGLRHADRSPIGSHSATSECGGRADATSVRADAGASADSECGREPQVRGRQASERQASQTRGQQERCG